jgi:hypothetical protein
VGALDAMCLFSPGALTPMHYKGSNSAV